MIHDSGLDLVFHRAVLAKPPFIVYTSILIFLNLPFLKVGIFEYTHIYTHEKINEKLVKSKSRSPPLALDVLNDQSQLYSYLSSVIKDGVIH